MAETDSKVYDLVYPSPIPLMDLSSIAVAIELWRLEVNQYVQRGEFGRHFYNRCHPRPRVTSRNILPGLPSIMHRMIEKYVQNIASSTDKWLSYNYYNIFQSRLANEKEILIYFNDIVCDYDGDIDYVRTAKRMILCDRISPVEKFKIACMYCFKEDIKRIGPSVRSNVTSQKIDYNQYTFMPNWMSWLLHYWMCWLGYESDEIPSADLIIRHISPEFRSSFEYFWNLAGLESRHKMAFSMCRSYSYDLLFFVRFILVKLNDEQLTKFASENVEYAMSRCVTDKYRLAIWFYIKDKIPEKNFVSLFSKELEAIQSGILREGYDCISFDTYREIWATASDKLKRSVFKHILSCEQPFQRNWDREPRVTFLLDILRDMSSEERGIFWYNNWFVLLCYTSTANLHRIMQLCFVNDHEISRFKKNTMVKDENITKLQEKLCTSDYVFIGQWSDALDFIYSEDKQIARNVRQKWLQQNLLDEYSPLRIGKNYRINSLHKFIDDAYGERASGFRNQILSEFGIESSPARGMRIGPVNFCQIC